jgi:predicted enzyme related to lactoylglutathione lyase
MSALVIFAVNVKAVANFYEAVVGLSPAPDPGDSKKDLRLRNETDEILIHSIPSRIAKTIALVSPPELRDECAMKPVFDVASLSNSLAQVPLHGGVLTDRAFTVDGATRHDVADPEGNIVQIRSSNP